MTMSLVTTCTSCGTVFRLVREQLEASGGWVRCGHCMTVFDAKAQFSDLDRALSEIDNDAMTSSSGLSNAGDLSFVTQAKKQAFWSSRSMRVSLSALSFLLLCVLLVQILRHEQDRLRTRWPQLNPLAIKLCDFTTCPTSAGRQIDDWLIDSSSFQKEGVDSFRLTLLLKNTSLSTLLVPSIELSLLGASDTLLIRQVVQIIPSEASLSMAGGADQILNFIITLKSDSNINSHDIMGYRLVLFYP